MTRRVRAYCGTAATLFGWCLAMGLLLAGCGDDEKREAAVPHGTVAIVAALPEGRRTGVATMGVSIEGAGLAQPVRSYLRWAGTEVLDVPVGPKEVTVTAYDANGNVVYRTSREADVWDGNTVVLRSWTWESEVNVNTWVLCLCAVLVALGLGVLAAVVNRGDLLLGYLVGSRWLVLGVSIGLGFLLASAGVFLVKGLQWVFTYPGPSAWVFIVAAAAACTACFELDVELFGHGWLDAALVGGTLGVAAVIMCVGYFMLCAEGFPWLALVAAGMCLGLLVRLALSQKL